MADPLSISAGVVGLLVPALHGLRLLLQDIERFRDAPRSIDRIKDDLEFVELAARTLHNLFESGLNQLESDIQDQLKTALRMCEKWTLGFHSSLQSWTRHSNGRSSLSLRDKATISLLADKKIQTMSTELQSIKAAFNIAMNSATIRIAMNRGGPEQIDPSTSNGTVAQSKQARRVFRLPFRRDFTFVNRPEMEKLESRMKTSSTRLALVGIGGIGKSQLAIEYCYRLHTSDPNTTILWIHASDAVQFMKSSYDISKHARLNDYSKSDSNVFETIGNWLQYTLEGRWIVVLDGLDDAEYLSLPIGSLPIGEKTNDALTDSMCILDHLPTTGNGTILVTSRSRQAVAKLVDPDEIIEIAAMDSQTAVEMLARKAGVEVDNDIAELATELNYVPLALAQAAAHLIKMRELMPPCKLLQKIRELESFKIDLLMIDVPVDLRRNKQSSNSVFLTWQIAFEQIKDQCPSAIDLLSVLSFFDNKNIPIWLFRGYDAGRVSHQTSDVSRSTATTSKLELNLCLLQDFLFITIDPGSDHLVMHDLVQMAVRAWLKTQSSLYHDSLHQSLQLLDYEFPRPKYEAWPKCMALLPHAMKLLNFDIVDDERLHYWTSIAQFSIYFAIHCGLQIQALSLLPKLLKIEIAARSSLNLCRTEAFELLTEEWTWTTDIAAALAIIYEYNQDFTEAEKRRAYILEQKQKYLGASHPATWAAMANLAFTHNELGRHDEALAAYQKVVEEESAVLGPHHSSTLTTLTNLAIVYSEKGDHAKAGRLYQEILKAHQEALPEGHPEIGHALWNLAVYQSRIGEYSIAEENMLNVVNTLGKTYKPASQTLLRAQTQLGVIYRNSGKWKQAVSVQEHVVLESRRNLGDKHPDTLSSLAQLATTYYEQGRYDMSEQIERDILQKRKAELPLAHPKVLETTFNLCGTLMELGRLDEAAQLATEALQLCPDHLHGMGTLGKILRAQEHHRDASVLNKRVLDISRKMYGNRFPDTLSAICNLAATRRGEGLLNEAEDLGREAVAAGHSVWGPDHPYQLIARTNLAETLIKQGKETEARELLEEVTMIRTKTIGSDHPDTVKSRSLLEELDSRSATIS